MIFPASRLLHFSLAMLGLLQDSLVLSFIFQSPIHCWKKKSFSMAKIVDHAEKNVSLSRFQSKIGCLTEEPQCLNCMNERGWSILWGNEFYRVFAQMNQTHHVFSGYLLNSCKAYVCTPYHFENFLTPLVDIVFEGSRSWYVGVELIPPTCMHR